MCMENRPLFSTSFRLIFISNGKIVLKCGWTTHLFLSNCGLALDSRILFKKTHTVWWQPNRDHSSQPTDTFSGCAAHHKVMTSPLSPHKNQLQCIFFCTNSIICERLEAGRWKEKSIESSPNNGFSILHFFLFFHFNKSSNQFVTSKHNAIHLNKVILCTSKKKRNTN